jgi:hypothetical protein
LSCCEQPFAAAPSWRGGLTHFTAGLITGGIIGVGAFCDLHEELREEPCGMWWLDLLDGDSLQGKLDIAGELTYIG